MKYFFILLFPFAVFSTDVFVKDPVINMFSKPTDNTDVVSQAIYGNQVSILEKQDRFYKIQTEDGYQGWVDKASLMEKKDKQQGLYPVKNLYAHIYKVEDTTPFPPVMTLPFGSMVKVLDITPKRWLPIELVDGRKAWIQRGDVEFNPKVKTLEEMLSFSKQFLGLPYTWGGRSSFGYDCSGFVQMLYKQMGITLPRDSRPQAACSLLESVDQEKLLPGDLIFFGSTRITHVGLYLGKGKFIHSTVRDSGPKIIISDLKSTTLNYISARRLKKS